MNTIKGNLLDMFDDKSFDVIVHGCNCHNNMGGGIAYQIAQRYPQVEQQDARTTSGGHQKLGQIDPVWMSGWVSKWFPMFSQRRFIINAYTQFYPGADGNIEAISLAFRKLAKHADNWGWTNARIGIPAIGCGIAGLTWEEVEPVIDAACPNLDITLVVFE